MEKPSKSFFCITIYTWFLPVKAGLLMASDLAFCAIRAKDKNELFWKGKYNPNAETLK